MEESPGVMGYEEGGCGGPCPLWTCHSPGTPVYSPPREEENVPRRYSLRRLGWAEREEQIEVSRIFLLQPFNTIKYSQMFCLKTVEGFTVSRKGKALFV